MELGTDHSEKAESTVDLRAVEESKDNDKEKLDWFKTINIAGAVLTAQELRNAIYPQLKQITDISRF